MKRTGFLSKLHSEGKILIVDPSDNVKKAYIQRSDESLSSAKALLGIGNLKDSVALSYYSMYHCLLAALFAIGIKCENHTAAIILLKEIFEIDNAAISKAKKERVDKQYYVDFNISKKEAITSIQVAEGFNTQLRDLIAKLNHEKILEYRKKTTRLIKQA